MSTVPANRAGKPADLKGLLGRWVADGLISAEQAERIRAVELRAAPAMAPPTGAQVTPVLGRGSLISEALGYLGGVLVIAAVILISTWYWADLAVGVRLGLAAGAAALALAAGLAVPERRGAAGWRLRSLLWLVSVAAFAGFLGLAGADVFGWQVAEDVVLLAAAGAVPYAAALWLRRPTVVQQVALFGAVIAAAGSSAARVDLAEGTGPGLAIWAAGAVWFALARFGVVVPQRAGYVLGSVAAVFGAFAATSEGWGHLVALVTVAALIMVAILIGDHAVLGVGAVAAALTIPQALAYFLPGEAAVPLGLLAVGILLVVVALKRG